MNTDIYSTRSLASEFNKASFGDKRLTRRLVSFIKVMSAKPAEGFPQLLKKSCDLEGWYRFLRNPKVTWGKIIEPHFQMTRKRVLEAGSCLVVHDTSTFCFQGEAEREGLCKITKDKQGFFGHFSLAVSLDSSEPLPLGLLGIRTFLRRDKGCGVRGKGKRPPKASGEKRRWFEAAIEISQYVGAQAHLIHVMDREADSLEIITKLYQASESFVIRVFHDRKLQGDFKKFSDELKDAPELCRRTVELSPRKAQKFPSRRKMYPARKTRKAVLAVSAVPVTLAKNINVSLVHVKEVNCPDDAPVEWILLCSDQVTNAEQAKAAVDIYRRRWLIEEYFKALKTGCSFEKRQLESRGTLENALAALSPVAWRLLLLKCVGRTHPKAPATTVLSPTQLNLLDAYPEINIPQNPNVGDAIKAIAELGGHIKNNGRPGWIVLGRGFDKLLWMEVGWRTALDAQRRRCDQS